MKEFTLVLNENDLQNMDQWLLRTTMSGREAAAYVQFTNKINKQLAEQNNPIEEVDKDGK